MAIPQLAMDMPAYLVYRDNQPGEAFDPTSPLLFFPPKGSDELFDALRNAFPYIKSHSERMREAVIQYLLQERHEEQSQQTSPAMTTDHAFPHTSSGYATSQFSSPDTMNMSTPASLAPSPRPRGTQLMRQASATTYSGHSSPTALDQMTSVFSLSTTDQPKQRVRRKMTEAEKAEYRKRRIVKACDKCAKRKRKCPHNQAEMETLKSTTSKPVAKVSKSTSPKSTKSSASAEQQVVLDPTIFSAQKVDFDSSFDFSEFTPTEDFDLFADPFPELHKDDALVYDHFQPMDEYQLNDFLTLDVALNAKGRQSEQNHNYIELDPTLSEQLTADHMDWFTQDSLTLAQQGSSGSLDGHSLLELDDFTDSSVQSCGNMTSSTDSFSSDGSRARQHGQAEQSQQAIALESENEVLDLSSSMNVEARNANDAHRYDGRDDVGINGNSKADMGNAEDEGTARTRENGNDMLSDHLRIGQEDTSHANGNDSTQQHFQAGQPEKPVPTHTSHVHDAECGGSSGLSDDNHTISKSTSPQMMSRRSRTEGAMRMFGDMSSRNALATSTISIEHAAVVTEQRVTRTPDEVTISRQELASTTAPPLDISRLASAQETLSSPIVSRQASHNTTSQEKTAPPLQTDQRGNTSLGEGLPAHADASMQLYMARKRVSSFLAANPRLQSRTTRKQATVLSTCSPVLLQNTSSPAAGGAYPRLESSSDDRLSSAVLFQTRTSVDDAVSEDRLSDHVRYRDHHGRPTPHEPRLCDTNKFKDHHGRGGQQQQQLSTYLLAMFGCALLLQAANVLPMLLPLLVVTAAWQITSEKIVNCTTKNSRWLQRCTAVAEKTKSAMLLWRAKKREATTSSLSSSLCLLSSMRVVC